MHPTARPFSVSCKIVSRASSLPNAYSMEGLLLFAQTRAITSTGLPALVEQNRWRTGSCVPGRRRWSCEPSAFDRRNSPCHLPAASLPPGRSRLARPRVRLSPGRQARAVSAARSSTRSEPASFELSVDHCEEAVDLVRPPLDAVDRLQSAMEITRCGDGRRCDSHHRADQNRHQRQ